MSGKILGIISLIIGSSGASLLATGLARSYWSKDGSGVWIDCSVDGCFAVRVMIVISTVFGIMHALILLLHVSKQAGPNTQKILISAVISALLAEIFFLLSIIVFDAKLEAGHLSFKVTPSFSYTSAGIVIILINLIVILLEN